MTVLNVWRHGVPKGAVVIMRPSKWSNRFRISNTMTRKKVMDLYRRDLWRRIRTGEINTHSLAELDGKDLVCCCAPRLCHGHILERAAAWAAQQCEG